MKRTVKKITETTIETEYEPRNFLKEQEDNYKARIDVAEGGMIGIGVSLVAVIVVLTALALAL